MIEAVRKVHGKGWTVNVSFFTDRTVCFIYSESRKELGFAQGNPLDESVITVAFDRAIEKSARLDTLKKSEQQEPLWEGFYEDS